MLALALALQLSTGTAQLGAPISASVETPPGLTLDLTRSTTDAYSISAQDRKDEARATRWTFAILPLAVGRVPIAVHWTGAGQDVRAEAELLVEEPAIPPDADIADIKDPARAWPAVWPWLFAAAAAAAAWRFWRVRRSTPGAPALPAAPPAAPDVEALARLDALARGGLWTESRYKEFYAELTEAVRQYFERRLGVPALKLTTAELARQLRSADADRKAVSLFRDVFERADLVKFAKTTPEGGQGPKDIDAARELVRLTSPAGAAPGGA